MADNNNNRKGPKFNFYWVYALMGVFLLSMLWMNQDGETSQEMNWTKFESIVAQGRAKSITVYRGKNRAEAILKDSLSSKEIQSLPAKDSSPFAVSASAIPTNKIAAQIPSTDEFEEYVKARRDHGVLTGEEE